MLETKSLSVNHGSGATGSITCSRPSCRTPIASSFMTTGVSIFFFLPVYLRVQARFRGRLGSDPLRFRFNSNSIVNYYIFSYVGCTIVSYRNVARSRCSAQVRSQGELELILLFVANARTLVDAYPEVYQLSLY
jgi:hypothetical protein